MLIAVITALILTSLETNGWKNASQFAQPLSSAISICVFIPWLRREGGPVCGDSRKEQKDRGPVRAGWIILAAAAGAVLSVIWGWISITFRLSSLFSNAAQDGLFASPVMIQIIGSGILAPVCEELLFRGILFRVWTRSFSELSGVIAVSLTFALYHGNVIQFLYAFPMGICFQLFLKKSGSLAGPLACHMAANMTAILVHSLTGL